VSTEFKDISLELTDGIYTALGSYITVNAVNYPVYVTMPKIAPDNYVYIGGVIQNEDGTKDDFIYTGSVNIRITTDNLHRAEKKLAREILSAVRTILKPSKSAVFALFSSTLVVFSHESLTELVGQTDNGLTRIDLVDSYNFKIE